MTRDPLISIITPVFDRERFLPAAVDSVLAQSYPHWELHIVEDGGPVAAERVLTVRDPRIHIHRVAHGGQAAARNHALGIARGDYVALLDDDDLFLPTALETRLHAAESRGGLVFTQWWWESEGKRALAGPARDVAFDELLFANPFGNSAALVRRALLPTPAYPAHLPGIEDWVLWLALAARLGSLPVLAEPTAVLRLHPGSVSANRRKMAAQRVTFFNDVYATRLGGKLDAGQRQVAAMHVCLNEITAGHPLRAAPWAIRMAAAAPGSLAGLLVKKAAHVLRERRSRV